LDNRGRPAKATTSRSTGGARSAICQPSTLGDARQREIPAWAQQRADERAAHEAAAHQTPAAESPETAAAEANLRALLAKQEHAQERKPQGQTQADFDAIMAGLRARDRIQDLKRQVREVRRDEMYEYNKAATEKGNRATYDVEEAADRKIRDLNGKINDARHEQSAEQDQLGR